MTMQSFRRTILAVIYLLCIPVIFFTARLVTRRSVTVFENTTAGTVVSSGSFDVALNARTEPSYDVRIPLPSDITPEDVLFENRYLEHALHITLTTGQRGFYLEHGIACDPEQIEKVTCLLLEDGTLALSVKTKTLTDPLFRLEGDALLISLTAPYEAAEQVIILDPVPDSTGSDTALSLAMRLKDALHASPLSCRVYLTRTDGNAASVDAVLSLIAESHASRCIRIQVPAGEAALSASVFLYDGFFIREYGNVPFASDVMRSLSAVENLRADGVTAVSDDAVLSSVKIPAVSVKIEGVHDSSGEDETLLTELAQALCTALRLGFEPAE